MTYTSVDKNKDQVQLEILVQQEPLYVTDLIIYYKLKYETDQWIQEFAERYKPKIT